jgi:lactoylglutathione lyase
MQPIDPSAKPDVSSPALNHVGLWIDRLPAAVGWLCCRGVRIARGGIRRGASGHDVCFIHPKPSRYFPISGSGALIELVQAPPDVTAATARINPGTGGR